MGALPKNKITRVERGKRRRGNTPKLKKDVLSSVPMHKRGFMAELLKFIGLGTTPEAIAEAAAKKAVESKVAEKPAKVATEKELQGQAARSSSAKPMAAKTAKVAVPRKAQHKG
jgi:hypothetical protein